MIRSRERRKAPRHVAVRPFARFGWWEGESFHHTRGRLSDLSSRGAALVVETVPAHTPRVGWFCVSGRSPEDWIVAKVVAIAKGSKGNRQIRLAFETPCPHAVFQAAVWGPSSQGASPTESQWGDELVVPPPSPEPPSPRPIRVAKPKLDAAKPPKDAEDWASAILKEAAETPNWAEVRAEIRARQRSRHLPLILIMSLNALLIVAIVLYVSAQARRFSSIQAILDSLNRP